MPEIKTSKYGQAVVVGDVMPPGVTDSLNKSYRQSHRWIFYFLLVLICVMLCVWVYVFYLLEVDKYRVYYCRNNITQVYGFDDWKCLETQTNGTKNDKGSFTDPPCDILDDSRLDSFMPLPALYWATEAALLKYNCILNQQNLNNPITIKDSGIPVDPSIVGALAKEYTCESKSPTETNNGKPFPT